MSRGSPASSPGRGDNRALFDVGLSTFDDKTSNTLMASVVAAFTVAQRTTEEGSLDPALAHNPPRPPAQIFAVNPHSALSAEEDECVLWGFDLILIAPFGSALERDDDGDAGNVDDELAD
ncbi:hypothetical protein PAXINDRAFT_15859 [Paxillus involutus ATCC 200175]|uniref:Uncharacterized protein n=1 Tax=Paxillus involutus ATCC 200175 TaxID=664439 RepID=A0A0C9TKP7_PAXIN|nr:hypothetical protein PAXINDRAFT_15859 [Paxillus involutus ATCC 200175]